MSDCCRISFGWWVALSNTSVALRLRLQDYLFRVGRCASLARLSQPIWIWWRCLALLTLNLGMVGRLIYSGFDDVVRKIWHFVRRSREISTADGKILRSCRISLTPLLHGVQCGHAACCSTHCGIKIWPANTASIERPWWCDGGMSMVVARAEDFEQKIFSVRGPSPKLPRTLTSSRSR